MAAYTDGPWRVVHPSTGFRDIRGPNEEAICTLFPDAGNGGVGHRTAEANARLIAAAPQMADEIERLRKVNAEMIEALKYWRAISPRLALWDGETEKAAEDQEPIANIMRMTERAIAAAEGTE